MNENVKRLLRKSGLDVYGLGKDRAKWEAAVERFAEGIVKECIAIADKAEVTINLVNETVSGNTAGVMIKNHFGVKDE